MAVLNEALAYQILSVVEEIPEGRVATYGQIARLIGRERNSRLVGKVLSMAEYYGDAPLDNIGFVLMDLNGDKVDELVIGAVAQAEQQGNEIFCIYSDPQNPSYVINGVEGKLYYLHSGEADGTYEAEIVGHHSAWIIETAERENTFDFNLKEGAMDPDGRMTLDLIPFSRYK